MQTVTEAELDQQTQYLNQLKGAELTQVLYDEKVLQLQLEKGGKRGWLTFSMKPGHPFLFYTTQRLYLIRNKKKPLGLFVKTHFEGESLLSVERIESLGRVVSLSFSCKEGQEKVLKFVLVPGHINIEAVSLKKSVFAQKPKELAEKGESTHTFEREVRDNQWFVDHWQTLQNKEIKTSQKVDSKDLKKKQSGLSKMRDKLTSMQNSPWKTVGDFLVENQSLDGLPVEWVDFVDEDKPLSWNIEHAFEMAKKNNDKILGTEERIEVLKKEIEQLSQGAGKPSTKKAKTQSLLKVADSKGKTIELDEGRLYIGRSGPENLKLLRRAKPWYLWLHIKDYPGAYGIIERKNKNKDLSARDLTQAALAVVKQSLPKSANGRFEVLYAECRYVRPIKGAKSGQVTYSHEKVMSVKVDS